jgi:hypothetical protein
VKRARLLLPLLLGLAVLPFPTGASASCAPPSLPDAEGRVLARGTSGTIQGRGFVDGCQDTLACSEVLGCERCEETEPPPTSAEDVALRLVQGQRSWQLAVADASGGADREGRVSWTFEVPQDAEPGPARLVADDAEPVRVDVR